MSTKQLACLEWCVRFLLSTGSVTCPLSACAPAPVAESTQMPRARPVPVVELAPPDEFDAGAETAPTPAPVPRGSVNLTLFEDTWFGMSESELESRYGAERVGSRVKRFPGPKPPFVIARTIKDVKVEVSFVLGNQGLRMVEISGVKSYGAGDDCVIDASTIAEWIAERAGGPTKRDSSETSWSTDTVHIAVFCDGGLGAYFEPAPR